MTIRVAAIGTGNVGKHALTQLIRDPRFELTGVWVSSEAKAGKDAAELAGLDEPTGVTATTDLEAILAARPECVVYTAMADNRLVEALEDYRRILAAGVNVVASAAVFLQYPWGTLPDEMLAPIAEAAEAGKASIFVNGIDPGFANDLLPMALAGTCQSIEQIRCMEIINYDTYDSATVMFDVMGFGKPLDETPMLLQPGVLSLAWGSVVRQLAAGLGVTLDEVVETHVREPAPEDFDIASGHIARGTTAALRFEVRGMVDGKPVVVLEHVTRIRDDLCPDWPQPAQHGGSYRIEITGEPSYALDLCLSSALGDHNHAGLVATAARVVNAIPEVVAAAPGIRTTLDLPLVTGKGLYAAD
ncbi:diacylglycerol kinase [Mycobacterium antarcticum]|uniref:NAD(P)H-dependent amine dehydrogenase family protein n=1 Tax=unclassified Mycolicibacterium TaxID=2636767 RepID=UPI002398C7CA|nr:MULTISPECIES: diacylglycerol kinase [unclassified Mycolicibacterium]BDX30423.1 diacylglycerol kinase [Mycolicibacterium sp. TUM20985]GLP79547.1 diacylglycerol kinase [Mycolicibacterium sp. TUM20984]